jgi:hypothetical protein
MYTQPYCCSLFVKSGVVSAIQEDDGGCLMKLIWVLFPSEWRESKVRYPVPWGGKGGNAS